MGQSLYRILDLRDNDGQPVKELSRHDSMTVASRFPDLGNLPPELAISILSHLNATDLCLAACVWSSLANDEILWQGLCRNTWGYVTAYNSKDARLTWKQLYLFLDEGTLTFNADAFMGMEYFFKKQLLSNSPAEIARFFHATRQLSNKQIRIYLEDRQDVLDYLVNLQSFKDQFLPNALRKFFGKIEAPSDRGNYLSMMLQKFSERFCECNPTAKLRPDDVFVLCYSLILLSVDLFCPHVKNKMSKREFIRNVRGAIPNSNDDLAGHLYDNVYLVGHVAADDTRRL